jgi:hypothetical protein
VARFMPLYAASLGGLEQGREDRRIVLGDQAAEMAGVVGIALEIGAIDLAVMRPPRGRPRRARKNCTSTWPNNGVLPGVNASRRSTSRCGMYPCGRVEALGQI